MQDEIWVFRREGWGKGWGTDRQKHTVVSAHWVSRDVMVLFDCEKKPEATTVMNEKGWANRSIKGREEKRRDLLLLIESPPPQNQITPKPSTMYQRAFSESTQKRNFYGRSLRDTSDCASTSDPFR